MRDALWDREHGGFHWAVNYRGTEATMADRHLYGQAFGLYALSEYALA
jgi:mannobiose 2-epimerase